MLIQFKMRIYFQLSVFLPVLSTVFLLGFGESTDTNSHMDREALIGLKSVINNDPLGALSSWGNGSSACIWTGVKCRHDGRVSELDLQGLNLGGRIGPHIGNLSALRSLYLQKNNFAGNIPDQLGMLGRLQTLNLSGNSLTGVIPSAFTNLSNLVSLDLSANIISGSIPSSIHLLQKLEVMNLGKNQLDGSIPPSIGNLTRLNTLDVNTNQLTNKIPKELGRMNNIQHLQLSLNNLKGFVPQELYNISTVTFFAFAKNDLYGEIPSDIGFRLPNLRLYHNCFNKFSGQIPASLHNITKIESIRMSHNQLSGPVPPGLSELHDLVMYNIGFNGISDSATRIITDLTNCTKLEFLGLDENRIDGSFPDSIGNLSSSLQKLYLGSNKISGQIPPSIGRLTSLTLLNLTSNQLSGPIPSEIGLLKELTVLSLTRNKLSGPLPAEIGQLTALTELEISNNELTGRIPNELGLLRRVLSLDISSNEFHGSIPASLFELESLSSILNLSHNSLTGALPETIGQLKKVIIIDLSNNFINSSIPHSIGQCQSLQTLSLSTNALSGVIPDTIGNLKGLLSLDLSNNQLTGSIPASLARLQDVQLLNLSVNDMSGFVPNTGIFKNNHSIVYLEGNPNLCYSGQACYHSQYRSQRRMVVIAVVAASVAVASISVLITVMLMSRRHLVHKKTRAIGSFIKSNHPLISYDELCRMTNNFDQTNLIGTGSFGSVYKAILQDGTPVAIKVFDLYRIGAPKSWVAECETLKNVRHRNLIKLVTICASVDSAGHDFLALVYELMSNGSLEDWIHQRRRHGNGAGLNAEDALNIAIDVASALEYMHNDCGGQVVHCDIKPSNVLLDVDMTAKVADFGLARLLVPAQPEQQSISSIHGLKGSIGYIPPEYGYGSQPSTKGDVYSYGVMLIEMITGKSPLEQSFGADMNLTRWVRENFPHRSHDIIDERLVSATIDGCFEGVHNDRTVKMLLDYLLVPMMDVALCCVVDSPEERSSMHNSLIQLKKVKETFLHNRSIVNDTSRQVDV